MKPLLLEIEELVGDSIINRQGLTGGSMAATSVLKFTSGKKMLLKTAASVPDMFIKEANGLKELNKCGAIRVPEVIAATVSYLLLEYIESGSKDGPFFEKFGRKFAEMHRCHAGTYGFYEDNYIGATPQINRTDDQTAKNWAAFYWQNRLLFQFKLAEKRGLSTPEMRKLFNKLSGKIEGIIAGSEEKPTLLHGDLWSGNFLAAEDGEPVVIDPAVYYGHREADLAMTKLFGGFDTTFYAAYQENNPLPYGWEDRENIYKLYHVLNHLNLFGAGYYSQAIALLRYYVG